MRMAAILGAALALAVSSQSMAIGRIADISVLDRTDNRRLQVYWHEGRAWVVGKPGNEYQITVRNHAAEPVMAVMSVDGINIVSGETARPDQTGYVLSPYRSFDIAGWRKSTSQTAAFYFTSLPDSYAARTGRPDDVGVIGVALFRRKPPEPPVSVAPSAPLRDHRAQSYNGPAARSEAPARGDTAASAESALAKQAQERIGTGHGRVEVSHVNYTSFERATPAPAEVVAIYYDSYRNLVARGVIRPPAPANPRAFPGFVPDPQSGLVPAPQARFAPYPHATP
ncbi:MAG: hypothetical protein ABI630_09235 [Betaproteobacteria bacterium]